jgi:hypothetical protein
VVVEMAQEDQVVREDLNPLVQQTLVVAVVEQ